MLIQVAVVVIFSTVASSTVLQGLFAISNIKDNVHELKKTLDDFKVNMTAQVRVLQDSLWENRKEGEPPGKHTNRTICLQLEVQQARMEINKLLNMLIEGEKNMLIAAESSLVNITVPMAESDLQQLHNLWGSLSAHGESRETIRSEMENFAENLKNRFRDVRRTCFTPQPENITESVRKESDESQLSTNII